MKTLYIRKRNVITTIKTKGTTPVFGVREIPYKVLDQKIYPSISKAKKESYRLQMAEGGLGRGIVKRG